MYLTFYPPLYYQNSDNLALKKVFDSLQQRQKFGVSQENDERRNGRQLDDFGAEDVEDVRSLRQEDQGYDE